MVPSPIAAEVPGIEERTGSTSPSGSPQSWVFSIANADGPFRRDLFIAAVAILGIAAHLTLRFGFDFHGLTLEFPLYCVLAFGGLPLVFRLIQKGLAREFGSDLLAGISIIASTLMGQYLVGSIVVLMLSGGTVLEEFATRRASSVLEALSKRMPETAHRKTEAGIVDIKAAEISIGDVLLVFPHEICPVDGIVMEGQGRMNEAYLTGEPYETSKAEGAAVISGAVNGESALAVRATKLPIDSRYARIMRVMQETQAHRPRLRRLGDMLGAWYTPLAVTIAIGSWLATGQSQRFLAVVVIATPCPLLLAIPVAIIGAISLAAQAQHHHQESSGAGAGGKLHDADFRQDRDSNLRPAGADGSDLRGWSQRKRRPSRGGEPGALFEAPASPRDPRCRLESQPSARSRLESK